MVKRASVIGDLLGLGANGGFVDLALLVNPTTGLEACPVLTGEVSALIVDNMVVHQSVDLVKVEEWDHGVAVVLGVVVGIPEQCSDEQVGAHGASVQEAVGFLGHLTVSMFEVAEIVHNRVAN